MSVLVAMPAKVRGAAASEGEVRSTVAWWQVCRRGVGRELDALMNGICEQRKAGCYKADQKQDAAQCRFVVSDVGLKGRQNFVNAGFDAK